MFERCYLAILAELLPSNFEIPLDTNNGKAYTSKTQRSTTKKKEAMIQNPTNQRSNNKAT